MVMTRENALVNAIRAKSNGHYVPSLEVARAILDEIGMTRLSSLTPIAEEARQALEALSPVMSESPDRLNDFANYVFSDGSTIEARIVKITRIEFQTGTVKRGYAAGDGAGEIEGG